MKLYFILASLFLLTISAANCSGDKTNSKKVYKARLEIKGICSNYTFTLLEGKIDTSKIVAEWTDGVTGKVYKNVFASANTCELPDTLKQGDEFYFAIDTALNKECMMCMAYYPKPPRSLLFKVVKP